MTNPKIQLARTLLAEALAISTDEIADDAAIGKVSNWDSLAHLRLIMAIEKVNGEILDAEIMVSIACLSDIAEALRGQYT